MDESRKAFEQWYQLNWVHTEDNEDSMFEVSSGHGSYYRLGVRMAYDAWQASRASIEIEQAKIITTKDAVNSGFTADYASGVLHGASMMEDLIHAAGLKVKE